MSRDDKSGRPNKPLPPKSQWRLGKALAAYLVALAGFTALDLWTKDWAVEALSTERVGEPPPVCEADEHGRIATQRLSDPSKVVVIVEDVLQLRYAENCGAAFGLLRDASATLRHAVFGLAALACSLALSWLFILGRGGPLFAASVPLIVSGALGNLIDRIRYGYVVDFIRYHGGFEWPTFNIADSTITVGVAFLLIDGMLEGRRERAAAEAEAAATEQKASSSKAPSKKDKAAQG